MNTQIANNNLDQNIVHRCVVIWEKLCQLHNHLYDLTCDEYVSLLNSDYNKIEENIVNKDQIINEIKLIEKERTELILFLEKNTKSESRIEKISDLIKYFNDNFEGESVNFFNKYNSLLIEIIEKIQNQNKKNLLLVNKGMQFYKELQQLVTGKQSVFTYNNHGVIQSQTVK